VATRLVAAVLAGNTIGAIVVSGILQNEVLSLTLAPGLLAAMLYVLWIGPGPFALDRRLDRSGASDRAARTAGPPGAGSSTASASRPE
jgi:uncharacterized membrane protein YphA (DoxX/SURF4 family)